VEPNTGAGSGGNVFAADPARVAAGANRIVSLGELAADIWRNLQAAMEGDTESAGTDPIGLSFSKIYVPAKELLGDFFNGLRDLTAGDGERTGVLATSFHTTNEHATDVAHGGRR